VSISPSGSVAVQVIDAFSLGCTELGEAITPVISGGRFPQPAKAPNITAINAAETRKRFAMRPPCLIMIKIIWIIRDLSTPLEIRIYPTPAVLGLDAGRFLFIITSKMTKRGPVTKLKEAPKMSKLLKLSLLC
jgi:hypothetical protein